MRNDRIIRLFLLAALGSLALGSLLGIQMALGLAGLTPLTGWPALLQAHGSLQVHGFTIILTLGVALLALPTFLGVPLAAEKVASLALLALLGGLGLRACGVWIQAAGLLQAAGVAGFLVVLRRTRAGARLPEVEPAERRLNRLHAAFMASGALWLLLVLPLGREEATADLVLWGFASMYVAGIGLRVHPQMLGLRVVASGAAGWSVLLWNAGVALEFAGVSWGRGVTIGAMALYLIWLSPFRRATEPSSDPSWLRPALQVAYGWWVLALLAGALGPLLDHAGLLLATRHLLASGFLLTMICTMAFRLIPLLLERLLVWPVAPPVVLMLLALGNLLRASGHVLSLRYTFAFGASLQVLAALLFSLSLGLTVVRPRLTCPPPLPPWAVL